MCEGNRKFYSERFTEDQVYILEEALAEIGFTFCLDQVLNEGSCFAWKWKDPLGYEVAFVKNADKEELTMQCHWEVQPIIHDAL
jgi:hypothetical protein